MKIAIIQKMIEDYVWSILYRHDLNVSRNNKNKERQQRIVSRCMKELEENTELLAKIQTKNQVEYYVRQTILLMI